MKKIILVISVWLLCGCGDYLKEYSQDMVVVKLVSDLDEILLGDVYLPSQEITSFSRFSYSAWLNFLDDDVNTVINRRGSDKWLSTNWLYGYSTWQMEVEKTAEGNSVGNDDQPCIETYYRINIINIILKELGELKKNNEQEKLAAIRIQGECHYLRAQFYFFLVNLYAPAYQKETANQTPGIPLKLTEYVESGFYRNSVAEVYDQIVADLKLAVDELTRSPQLHPQHRVSSEAAALLLSRVYLYMQDWTNARLTASGFLKVRKELVNAAVIPIEEAFMEPSNKEVVFSQGTLNIPNVLTAAGGDFCVSAGLYRLYEEKDYRKNLFFNRNLLTDSISLHRKYLMKPHRAPVSDAFTLRVAEAYLNLAEACAMQGDQEANVWLNNLRRYRIEGYADQNYSGEELVRQVRDERRKELCFEGHRWFDLRRYAVCTQYPYRKTIDRIYARYIQDNRYTFDQAELYRLEENDPAYTFRIPASIRDFHNEMPDNIRNPRKALASVDVNGNVVEKEQK